jgi:hypothetical protein
MDDLQFRWKKELTPPLWFLVGATLFGYNLHKIIATTPDTSAWVIFAVWCLVALSGIPLALIWGGRLWYMGRLTALLDEQKRMTEFAASLDQLYESLKAQTQPESPT